MICVEIKHILKLVLITSFFIFVLILGLSFAPQEPVCDTPNILGSPNYKNFLPVVLISAVGILVLTMEVNKK